MKRYGPIDDRQWAESLDAHVVDVGPPIRVHGYALVEDLAQCYSSAEVMLTALRGEVPTPPEGRAFELATTLLAASSIAEAPAHAAALAGMMRTPASAMVAIAGIVLAEQARSVIESHAAWLAWLDAPASEEPPGFAARGADDIAAAALARARTQPSWCPALARSVPTREATALALLHACGLRSPAQLVTVLVVARLPMVVAEAEAHAQHGLSSYPMQLPRFEYEEGEGG